MVIYEYGSVALLSFTQQGLFGSKASWADLFRLIEPAKMDEKNFVDSFWCRIMW